MKCMKGSMRSGGQRMPSTITVMWAVIVGMWIACSVYISRKIVRKRRGRKRVGVQRAVSVAVRDVVERAGFHA